MRFSLIAIAAIFFVVGIVLMALANNGVPGPLVRVAWIFFMIAAIIWFVATQSGATAGG